jgi:DNA adenine methylase
MASTKSFLRWAGSKNRLIPKLSEYWNESFIRYVEPFAGSAAFFFAIRPLKAVLSDINSDLIDTLCAVRDHPRAIHNRLCRFPLGEEAYYRIRQEDASQFPVLDRSARFIYLNRFCFNGLYRTNMSGKFNVPYAASKTGRLPTMNELNMSAKVLSNAQIQSTDFEETLKNVQPGDFVYMDPPYAVKNRRIFRQYGPDSFGTEDLARLALALHNIDRCGAKFLVSYAICKEALDAFSEWHIRRVQTQRSIAGFSQHRRKAVEILVSNQKPSNENTQIFPLNRNT